MQKRLPVALRLHQVYGHYLHQQKMHVQFLRAYEVQLEY